MSDIKFCVQINLLQEHNRILTKIIKKYNGVILTGSTLRINDNSEEVKKHIEFTRRCFEHTNYIYAACWGLQVSVAAAGGKCRVSQKEQILVLLKMLF